jgi:apolipoprotein N-acyltransferase
MSWCVAVLLSGLALSLPRLRWAMPRRASPTSFFANPTRKSGFYGTAAGLIWYTFSRRLQLTAGAGLWLIPVLVGIAERASPMLFNWNFGYPWLRGRLPAFQLADIIGFQGLSTLTLFFSGLIVWTWYLWLQWRRWGQPLGRLVFCSQP